MRFRLTPRSMTLDARELLGLSRIRSEFREISYIWEPTTTKRMKIDPNRQHRNFSPFNVLLMTYRLR